jgi:hypothetical protein
MRAEQATYGRRPRITSRRRLPTPAPHSRSVDSPSPGQLRSRSFSCCPKRQCREGGPGILDPIEIGSPPRSCRAATTLAEDSA